MVVAPMARPMMNLENVFCRLNAIRRAMKTDTFNGIFLYLTNVFYLDVMINDKLLHFQPVPVKKMTCLLLCLCLFCLPHITKAQLPDWVYKSNIQSVRFHMYGNQLSLPVYNMNSGDQVELHFDDMDADLKSYYYCLQLCDYDWKPLDLSPFLYTKGFTQTRVSTYRYSSIALTRYTHYSAILPDRGTTLTMSGNYLLKVYLDGDTSKLVFTRRLLVLEPRAAIKAQVLQPFSPQVARTHQKIAFTANITGINSFSAAQQVKVVILQNNRWDNSQRDIVPAFVRGNLLDYSSENSAIFPGGKEWRWLDLRSFRLQSDKVDSARYNKASTDIYLRTDRDLSAQRYVYFKDYNGMYMVETYETINPYSQGDYATVYFSLAGSNGKEYPYKDIYLNGQLTGYEFNDKTRMKFNAEKGVYECTAYLKQGYYNYTYVAVDRNNPDNRTDLEGNYWETENNYTILMYYKSFTDRADRLIGVGSINSRTDRPGISF